MWQITCSLCDVESLAQVDISYHITVFFLQKSPFCRHERPATSAAGGQEAGGNVGDSAGSAQDGAEEEEGG